MIDFLVVDFGTTKLCVSATYNTQRAYVEFDGEELIPNAVYFGDTLLFGKIALSKGRSKPQFLLTHLKELMGIKFDDPAVKDMQKKINQKIVKGRNGFCALEIPFNEPVVYEPCDILCCFLKFIKEKAEEQLPKQPEGMLMGISPSFNELQKEALRITMLNTGFKYVSFREETTAVCASYNIQPISQGSIPILVADCGGGTFDVSVVIVTGSNMDVVIMKGNPRLGGKYFTQAVLGAIYDQINILDPEFDLSKLSLRNEMMLRDFAELLKIQLSAVERYDSDITLDGKRFHISMSRSEFNAICKPLFMQCEEVVKSALDEAAQKNIQVQYLCLSGSSFNIPKLQKRISKLVKLDAEKSVLPSLAVVVGLRCFALSDQFQKEMEGEYKERNSSLFKSYVDQHYDGPDRGLLDREISKQEQVDIEIPMDFDVDDTADPNLGYLSNDQIEIDKDLSYRVPSSLNPAFPNLNDSMLNFSSISLSPTPLNLITTSTYDLSFQGLFRGTSDRTVLYNHASYRGTTQKTTKIILKPSKSYRVLYQGNSLFVKDLVAIKKYYLHYDAQHPKNKSHKCLVTCRVTDDGTIDIKFFWDDTKEPIQYDVFDVSASEASIIKRQKQASTRLYEIFDSDGTSLSNPSPQRGLPPSPPKVPPSQFLSTIPELGGDPLTPSTSQMSIPLPLPPAPPSPSSLSGFDFPPPPPFDFDAHPVPEFDGDADGLFPPGPPLQGDHEDSIYRSGPVNFSLSTSSLRMSDIQDVSGLGTFDPFSVARENNAESFQFLPMNPASDVLQVPNGPEIPNGPGIPDVLQVPNGPEIPSGPRIPDVLQVPNGPEIPSGPRIPEIPSGPRIPEIPEIPPQPRFDFSTTLNSLDGSQGEVHSFGTIPVFDSVEEYCAVINRLKAQVRKLLDGRCMLRQADFSRPLAEINRWLMSPKKQIVDAEKMLVDVNTILSQLENC